LKLTVGVDASVVGSSSGGTRIYALQLLENLIRVRPTWDFRLYLRHSRERNELADILQLGHVRTQVVGGRPNAWRVQVVLPTHLATDGIDIYHSLGFFLPIRWRGPKVVTIHDLNVYAQARSWLRAPTALKWLDLAVQTPFALRSADRVITDSESSRVQISRHIRLPQGKVTVIPLGADPFFDEAPASDETSEAQALTGGKPFVLFVGILSPIKNLLMLMHAFAVSRLAAAGVRLVLAGSDREAYAVTLRRTAQALGIAHLVDMPGFVSQGALRALYHGALGYVLPSIGEGFGLPLVECMACGTPILAANRQAIPEVLGDAGCLFEPDDAEGLAKLLNRLVEDDEYRKGLAARARHGRDRFSWRRTAEATAAVYEEVVSARRL
jgi:glycosyltransferase involved in cell wall biosynthesis